MVRAGNTRTLYFQEKFSFDHLSWPLNPISRSTGSTLQFASQIDTSCRIHSEWQKTAVELTIEALLQADLSVVLDYPANTLSSRQWAKGIFEKAEVAHQLHYLDVPDAVCKARLHERNASGTHPFATSDAEFDQITKHFVPPSPDEAMNIILHQFGK